MSSAGLAPALSLAGQAGLSALVDEHVRLDSKWIPSAAANPVGKVISVIAGMLTGADGIEDLQAIRSGGSQETARRGLRPGDVGMFLREFTHGHTRQLSAVLTRHLLALTKRTRVLTGIGEQAFVDIDSLLRPVYGHAKRGASFGHTKIANRQVLRKGLSPLVTTISTPTTAPVIAGVRPRAGKAGSGPGAATMITEAINTAVTAGAQPENIIVR